MAEKRNAIENTVRRYRLYPNNEQRNYFARCFGCVRFVYNMMLAEKIAYYQETGKSLRNTPAKYKKDYPWLKEVDALALSNAQLHLEQAYRNFFRDPRIGFPKFKSKHRSRDAYTTNVIKGNIRLEGSHLRLPKIGKIRLKVHRRIDADWILKSVTVSREPSGKYYAALLYARERCENQTSEIRDKKVLGIDFSMKELAVFSDGTSAAYPMYYRTTQKKLAREQRKLSHCQKGSQNYRKQRQKLARAHEKIRHQRNDFQHKLSHRLTEEYDVIVVENLNMKGMSGGLHFGKSVMDNGFGAFIEKLEYKLERKGKIFIKIDRFYPSSKTCSRCGKIKAELTLSERTYICCCGNRMDRDLNAAINIREEGKRLLGIA
ncbi:MAG: RNA-guided endonuclease TnpB family protein [Lachnospiraceae bacterium]|nr:RNA-guided endonuclease TnpB family protein [Lachnospiraceae bacterium]